MVNGTVVFSVTLLTAGNNHRVTAGGSAAPIVGFTDTSDMFTVQAEEPSRLQVLAPGEYAVAGSTSGSGGAVTTRMAGVSFEVTVNATDDYFNPVDNNSYVRIDTSDKWDIHPSTVQLTGGTTNFWLTLVTAVNDHKLYAVDTDQVVYNPLNPDGYNLGIGTSSIVTVIPSDVDTFFKLQVLVPGETAEPGRWDNSGWGGNNPPPFGKLGTPTTAQAGVDFDVEVNLVDRFQNVVGAGHDQWVELKKVGLESDPYGIYPSSQPLVDGTTTFTFEFRTAGPVSFSPLKYSTWTVTIQDVDPTPPTYGNAISQPITVEPGPPKKLQVLLSSETWKPGKISGTQPGKLDYGALPPDNRPVVQVAGSSFTITVHACDDFWNVCDIGGVVNVYQHQDVTFNTAGDPNADTILSKNLVNGRQIFEGRLVTATTGTFEGWVIAADRPAGLTGWDASNNFGQRIKVAPAKPTMLLVLVPNQLLKVGTPAGSPTGRNTSNTQAQLAGVEFDVTTYITDDMWNVVTTTAAGIRLTTTDPNDDDEYLPFDSGGGFALFNVKFRTVGSNYTITASTTEGHKGYNFASNISDPINVAHGAPVSRLM
jgi:hypothetical protein